MNELVAALTLEEKVALCAGEDWWHTPGVERLGVLPYKVSDGPSGARGKEAEEGPTSANFPCGTALAATWDAGLVSEVGRALGDEARSKGAHALLAPTVNLHRTPLGGRGFECLSEDPFLTARLAVAYIRGVQSQGVAAVVKHFAANDSEFERHTISSEVSERVLRELYLVPFEAAVREAGTWGLMSSYNRVNGTYAAEHSWLLGQVLRREWGYDGYVVSDWYGMQSTEGSALAGNDLEMPGPPTWYGSKLLAAVREGRVPEAVVDASVARLLLARERSGVRVDPRAVGERADDRPEHRSLIRRVGAAASVLLRNEGGALPVEPASVRRVAVIGPNADVARTQGGGSARVRPHYTVSPLDGLRAAFEAAGAQVVFERGCDITRSIPPLAAGEVVAEWFAGAAGEGEAVAVTSSSRMHWQWWGAAQAPVPRPFWLRATATFVATEAGDWTLSLTSVGPARVFVDGAPVLSSSAEPGESFWGRGSRPVTAAVPCVEGQQVEVTLEYSTGDARGLLGVTVGLRRPVPADLRERAVAAAADADAVVLVAGMNDDWETEGRDRDDFHLPGGQDELIAAVAAACPRTVVVVNAGSAVAMPWLEAVGAVLYVWYPGQELGNAVADVVTGAAEPGGRLPTTFPARLEDVPAVAAGPASYPGQGGRVVYAEELGVGYRGFDERGTEPRFPFGHGLSYTSFSMGPELRVEGTFPDLVVEVEVTNTGEREGSEVVQLYVRDVEASVPRPPKELKAFAKVTLAPGQTAPVSLRLDERSFAFWHPDHRAWTVEPGDFELLVGRSAGDLPLVARVPAVEA